MNRWITWAVIVAIAAAAIASAQLAALMDHYRSIDIDQAAISASMGWIEEQKLFLASANLYSLTSQIFWLFTVAFMIMASWTLFMYHAIKKTNNKWTRPSS